MALLLQVSGQLPGPSPYPDRSPQSLTRTFKSNPDRNRTLTLILTLTSQPEPLSDLNPNPKRGIAAAGTRPIAGASPYPNP